MVRIMSLALVVGLALLAVGLGAKVVASVGTQAAMLSYPFQFDESEGMIVAETILLDKGVDIFAPLTPDLFIAAPYPPLFYMLAWPFQHLLGDEPSFKIGRALSLLSTLMSGLGIFGIVVALTKNKLAGVVSGLAFWSFGLVTFWGTLVKPDMLALALGLCGLWWVIARPTWQAWWALPLFVLAFYTKQTAIAGAVAATGWLFSVRPRTGIAFGALYGVGLVVPGLLLNWMTDGGYFYHMFTIHSLPWFGDRFVQYTGNLLIDYGALLVPGLVVALVLGAVWAAGRLRRRQDATLLPRQGGLLVFLYVAASFAVASGTGTLGGNHNHLLDLTAALCIALGVGFGLLLRAKAWQWKAVGLVPALVALASVPVLFNVPVWLQLEFNQLNPDRTEGMMNIFQYVTNNGGAAYSDNVGLLLTTHKKLWSTDPFTQTHATANGRWDQTRLVREIATKGFSQIILRIDVNEPQPGAGDVSPEILQAVRDNYKLDQRNVLNIYVPR
ncbi:MAG: hypothetical protein ABI670_08610 [Chloroflexota bacterium]